MAEKMKRIEKDFEKFKTKVMGILVFGSSISGYDLPASDVDVCLVSGMRDNKELFGMVLESGLTNRYDVKIFEDLPLKVQGAILEKHAVVWAKNDAELSYYLYKFRRIWNDQKLSLKKLGLKIFS